MSKPKMSRDQNRDEKRKIFQGYIYQELVMANRWSTYSPCDYAWLCEFENNQHLFIIIKYLLKQKNYDFDSFSPSTVKEVLSSLDQESFVLCLNYIERNGSLEGYPAKNQDAVTIEQSVIEEDLVFVRKQEENSSSISSLESAFERISINSESAETGYHSDIVELTHEYWFDEEQRVHSFSTENFEFVRPESVQISMMNKYPDEIMPCVVVCNYKIRDYIEEVSSHQVRNFDKVLTHYSPITITSDATLLRCGRQNFVIKYNGSDEGIRSPWFQKYFNYTELKITDRGIIQDLFGSTNHILHHWLQRHHFEVVGGNLVATNAFNPVVSVNIQQSSIHYNRVFDTG